MNETSGFDWLTFGLAAAGLLVALSSLAWQAWTWKASGPRISVRTTHGLIGYTDGSSPCAIGVDAANRGRSAVDVTGWGFTLPDGEQIVLMEPAPWMGPPVPVRLEQGQSTSWTVPAQEMIASLRRHQQDTATPLRAFVRLGTGAIERANQALPPPPFD